MDTSKAFPFSLDYEGKHHSGWITPSEELGNNGVPVYYRVELGNSFFAYLCCTDNGWKEKDEQGRPNGLVNAIGAYIKAFYG